MRDVRKLTVPLLLLVCSCHDPPPSSPPEVQIGVFFGGQIQRLKKVEIPAVRPPKIGFRVQMPKDPSSGSLEEPIRYEIVRPGPAGRRVTEKGTLIVPQGQARMDHVIELDASSNLGLWNVRVVQGHSLLADRALYLSEAAGGQL